MQYQARKFNLPELKGLSAKQIEVHLGLYEGYVRNINLLMSTIAAYEKTDDEGGKYAISEMRRRLGWEFDGMRMHEYYFEQLRREVGAPTGASGFDGTAPNLAKAAAERYGSGEKFIEHIKEVAGTRGIGWVVVYYDPIGKTLHTAFVNDHELGQLAGLPIILALDLWEHAYMVDYLPKEKNQYVAAFLENLNWSACEARYDRAAA